MTALKCDPKKLPKPLIPTTREYVRPPANKAFIERLKRQAKWTEMLFGEIDEEPRHKPKSTWTPEQEKMVWELHKQGVKQVDIAEKVGRSKTSVSSKIQQIARRESGYTATKKPRKVNKLKWTEERDREVEEYARRGMTCSMIADLTGRTPAAICQRLKVIRRRNAAKNSDM